MKNTRTSGASRPVSRAPSRTPNANQSPTKPTASAPPPGLDDARHAAAQKAAHGAEVLRQNLFASLMAGALSLDRCGIETSAFKTYLQRFMDDLGSPQDPIERMMAEQVALAHFRIAQLHVGAAESQSLEAIKLYNSTASRLMGEFRRTCIALHLIRSRPSASDAKNRLKVFKAAQ